MTTFCDYLYAVTDNTTHGLEIAKENALSCYKAAKKALLESVPGGLPGKDSILWHNFNEAKKVCMFLGVRI